MHKLNFKDKRILYELDLNARIPTTILAKKTGLSQPVCHYRLNKLIEKRVIKFFLTNIDYGFFNYFPYRFFCRLQNLSEEKEQEMISYLKEQDFVPFLASCTGRYDLMFCIMAKNISDLKKHLNKIKNKYGEHFSEQHIATILTGEFYPRDYLLGEKQREKIIKKEFGEQSTRPRIDMQDKILLKELSNHCRKSLLEISTRMKLSLDAARYRLKNLEKSKVINGYTVYLDNEVLGQSRYKIMILLSGATDEKENRILSYAQSFPNVVYAVRTFGAWDLEIDVEVETPEQFIRVLRDIKNKNSELIKEYQTINLTSVHKYNHFPMKAEDLL